jgi:hypothetical protein
MAYELRALIGAEALLADVARDLARAVSLRQSLGLIPMTDELFDALSNGTPDRFLGFWKLPGGFEYTLAEWSTGGPLAYVEAEFFGGVGEQRAAVWVDGALPERSLHVAPGESLPDQGSPISQALRQLGVVRGTSVDEFDAVGLQRHRYTEDWAAEIAGE